MAPPKAGYAPNLESFLRSLKGNSPLESLVESLVALLRRGQIRGAESCAIATAHILLQVVAKQRWTTVDDLISHIQRVGQKLVHAQPRELSIGNVVRRILHLIRTEAVEDHTGDDPAIETHSEASSAPVVENTNITSNPSRPPMLSSMSSYRPAPALVSRASWLGHHPGLVSRASWLGHPGLLSRSSYIASNSILSIMSPGPWMESIIGTPSGTSTPLSAGLQHSNIPALRSEIVEGIEEIKDEILSVDDQVASFAETHIHSGDFVLVFQPSSTAERFLLKAAAKRRFTVLLCGESRRKNEEAPFAHLRKRLSTAKVDVIRIAGTGAMAYMSRVTKVIVDAKAILSNGGVLADGGADVVARAAHEMGRPVIVLGGVYKVSPESPMNVQQLIEWGDPSAVVKYSDGPLVLAAQVENIVTDFIEPDLIDIYITNLGPNSREQLQGIIADHYQETDLELGEMEPSRNEGN